MNNRHTFISYTLLLSLFQIDGPVVVNTAERPDFIGKRLVEDLVGVDSVTEMFQKASEYFEPFGAGFNFNTPRDSGIDLSHVISWSYIDYAIDRLMYDPDTMKTFISYVTDVDEEAVFWVINPNLDVNETPIRHKELLLYNDTVLFKLNSKIREESYENINYARHPNGTFVGTSGEKLDKIKTLLNSAPANLRYGVATINRKIQDNIDPMGTEEKKLTSKERVLTEFKHTVNKTNTKIWKYVQSFRSKTSELTFKNKLRPLFIKRYRNPSLIVSSTVFGDPENDIVIGNYNDDDTIGRVRLEEWLKSLNEGF